MAERVLPFFVKNCSISHDFLGGSPKSIMSRFLLSRFVAVFSTEGASFAQVVHISVHKTARKLVDNWVADLVPGQLHSS
jgi:hypothetical protein